MFDTKIKAGTASLVDIFMKKIQDVEYRSKVQETLVPDNDQCIASFIKNDLTAIREGMKKISMFQLKYMNEAIPFSILDLWQEGLKTEDFFVKLCGSGGGGYLLIWSEMTQEILESKLNCSLSKLTN